MVLAILNFGMFCCRVNWVTIAARCEFARGFLGASSCWYRQSSGASMVFE